MICRVQPESSYRDLSCFAIKPTVEVVRACDAKRGTLRRKAGNGNESTGEKEERKT